MNRNELELSRHDDLRLRYRLIGLVNGEVVVQPKYYMGYAWLHSFKGEYCAPAIDDYHVVVIYKRDRERAVITDQDVLSIVSRQWGLWVPYRAHVCDRCGEKPAHYFQHLQRPNSRILCHGCFYRSRNKETGEP